MDDEVFEVPVVSDASLEMASIGDVFLVSAEREVPADYQVLDGSRLPRKAYPDFATAMSIVEPTFTLPAPTQIRDGAKFIIKLGLKREVAPPPPAPVMPPPLPFPPELDPAVRRAARREAFEARQGGRLAHPEEN